MNSTTQLNLDLKVPSKPKTAWAFGLDVTKHHRKMRSHGQRMVTASRNFNSVVITAVSREAKVMGVQVGMKYADAKLLVPDLRILVSNA